MTLLFTMIRSALLYFVWSVDDVIMCTEGLGTDAAHVSQVNSTLSYQVTTTDT